MPRYPGIVALAGSSVPAFEVGTAVETEITTLLSVWDLSVTLSADHNALFVMFGGESSTLTVTSVVLDPGGANQTTLTLVQSAVNSATKTFIYGMWGFSGISGTKTLQITLSETARGVAVHNLFKGAANATPTPTDTDNSAGATTLANSLPSPNANGCVLAVGQCNITSGVSLTGSLSEVGSYIDTTNGFYIKVGRKVGGLVNPEIPGISQGTSQRVVICSCVVNPAA